MLNRKVLVRADPQKAKDSAPQQTRDDALDSQDAPFGDVPLVWNEDPTSGWHEKIFVVAPGEENANSPKESERLQALFSLSILDTLPEQNYDDVTELASFICGTPIALVSLVAQERQWFKSSKGLDVSETPRSQSFCAYTIPTGKTLIVEDALLDARFSSNPLVLADPKIRFYAGAPVFAPGGEILGTVCVIDREPRVLSPNQTASLEALARQVTALLAQRQLVADLSSEAARLAEARDRLERSEETLALATEAADIAAWYYDPSLRLVGGDEAMSRLFGVETSEAPAEVWLKSVHEEDRHRVSEEFEAGVAGTPYNTEYRLRVDASIRWVRAKASLTGSASHERMVGICEDITDRKLSEEALRITANRLQLAQESARIAVWDWDMVSNTFFFDAAITSLFGRSPEVLRDREPVFESIHPDDRAVVEADISRALEPGGFLQTEFRALWPDGSVRWIAGRGRVSRSREGIPVRMTGVNTDITESVLARKQLEASEARSNRILASIGDAVIVTDGDKRITRMNPVAENLTRWTDQEAKGRPLTEVFRIVNESTRAVVESPADKVSRLGTVVGLANHTILIGQDGTETQIDDSGAPIRDDDGNLMGIVLVFRDIEERRTAERIRENLTTQLEQILAATTDGVAMLDRDWNFVFLNERGKHILEAKGDLLGKNAWDEFPAMVYENSPFVYHYNRAMNEDIAGDFVAEYPDPLNIVIQIFARPVSNGIIVMFRDITDQKRSERALLQNEKLAAVGRLASSIAHEINNPLESVTNLLYLARTTNDLAAVRGYLSSADTEMRRASAITSQTLRFHKQSTSPTEVSAEDLVESTFAIYESRIRNSQINVEKQTRKARPVRCLDGEIRQVLSNLIVNAIDAMPAGGRLLFRSREGHNWRTGEAGLRMTVADTGSGIPGDVVGRAFEAFFTTKGIGGTGLGLWISKGIVDRHHGSISLRSSQEPRHCGTVAMLFLPFC